MLTVLLSMLTVLSSMRSVFEHAARTGWYRLSYRSETYRVKERHDGGSTRSGRGRTDGFGHRPGGGPGRLGRDHAGPGRAGGRARNGWDPDFAGPVRQQGYDHRGR